MTDKSIRERMAELGYPIASRKKIRCPYVLGDRSCRWSGTIVIKDDVRSPECHGTFEECRDTFNNAKRFGGYELPSQL